MAWDYSEKLKDHFFNPRNILEVPEEEYKADGVGEVGNIKCGDMMKMYIKIGPDEKISECKWKTYGCASAIGSTSLLSTMVIGKTIEEALKITPDDIVNELGGLPAQKFHCSVLGDKALRARRGGLLYQNGTDRSHYMGLQEYYMQVSEYLTGRDRESHRGRGFQTFRACRRKPNWEQDAGQCIDDAKKLFTSLLGQHCGTH